MPYHTFAYEGSVGSTANTTINAVSDGIYYIQNNHIVPPKDIYLYGVAAMSANLSRARIISPSIRQTCNSHVRPINTNATPPDNPKLSPYWNNPLKLRGQEEIIVDVTSSISTGSETANVVFFAGPSIDPVPVGDVLVLRATGSTTLTANTWTQVPLTFDDVIPVGTYACVGLTAQSSTCISARLTFDGQFERPGTLGITSLGNTEHIAFASRQFGKLGTFRSTSLPRVEFLSNSSDSSQVVYLEIIRVGS